MTDAGARAPAAPEAPIRIGSREELVYLLSQASELEHGLMCEYLFAMFSLKRAPDEGLSPEQLELAGRWDRTIAHVATQEMLHVALVSNLLTAVGAAPHLEHPNFPQQARYYPPGVQLALLPFGERALRHFLYLERPEGMLLQDAEGFEVRDLAVPVTDGTEVVPVAQSYATVGHLYRGIQAGLEALAGRLGERRLFVGPPEAQATGATFRWPELVAVTDVASATVAIETIVEQGEGARGDWRHAHYGLFTQMLAEYREQRAADPDFEPARPVVPAFTRPPADVADPVLVSDKRTAQVADLFNGCYEVLLQLLVRFFTHTEETAEQLGLLADAAVWAMFGAIKPLGYLLTSLPVGVRLPGRTAGPTFEYFRTAYFLPHRRAAWTILHERLTDLAGSAAALAERTELATVAANLGRIAGMLARGLDA